MDKKVSVQLNGTRKVVGTLRGFDVCMNKEKYCKMIILTIIDVFEYYFSRSIRREKE